VLKSSCGNVKSTPATHGAALAPETGQTDSPMVTAVYFVSHKTQADYTTDDEGDYVFVTLSSPAFFMHSHPQYAGY
jgi:hypothetical protein